MNPIKITFTHGTNEDWEAVNELILEINSMINRARLTIHARAIVLRSLARLAEDAEQRFENQLTGVNPDEP